MLKRAVFLLFFLFTAIPGFSSTYYVSKTGLDAHSCSTTDSAGTNKLTITAGIACLSAADTLIVHAGTYAEAMSNPPSGTSDLAHTIVQAAPGEVVTLTGVTSGQSYNLAIESKDYITIDGFHFNEATSVYGATVGDSKEGLGGAGSTYILLQNNEFYNADLYSCLTFHIVGTNHSIINHHITVKNNIVHDCGTTTPTTDTFDGHGIYPKFHDSIVEGNTVYNIGTSMDGGAAIHQYDDGDTGMDANIYRNNTVYDSYGSGIILFGGTNNLVYNNVLYNNGIKVEGAGALRISTDMVTTGVYNNTVVDNNDGGVYIGAGTGALVKNNISYLNDVSNYSNSGTGTTHTTNLEGTDPSFINTTTRNYHLASGSVAIEAGADLSATFSTDRDGVSRTVPYDQGAYAYSANVVPPACSFDVCETFDNYPLTTDLNGLNSGTGWTGAWTKASGSAMTIETAPAGGEGGMAANSTAASTYTRTFTAATAGSFRVLMRWSTPTLTANAKMNFILSESTSSSAAVIISIATDGNIVAYDGTTMADVTLLSFPGGSDTAKNVWSTVDIEFDDAAQPDLFRARVNLGAWSAWLGTNVAYTNLDKAWIEDNATNTHDFWADAIGGSPAGTTAVPYNAFTSTRIR